METGLVMTEGDLATAMRPDLLHQLRRRLNLDGKTTLDVLGGLTKAQKVSLYLVGGSVRDLVLEKASLDLDLVVEGEVERLALELATAVGGRCILHREFGTASVRGQEFSLDLATARLESYPRPGALPVVRPGTLSQDLARRDFTINAMALALAGPGRARLVDPYDGLGDAARGLIRVLHDGSFVDDATRILRAIRYEARLGFRLESHTLSLVLGDKGYLATVNAARLRLEFQRFLREEAPEVALRRCQELGILAAIHPSLRFDDSLAEAFRQARGRPSPPSIYLALLALLLTLAEASDLARRLAATKAQRVAMEAVPTALALAEGWRGGVRPSRAARALRSFPEASLWAVALGAPHARSRDLVRRYLEDWRLVRPALNGQALRRLGVPPGPKMGEVLERLWEGRLDGHLHRREDEIRLVREMVDVPEATV